MFHQQLFKSVLEQDQAPVVLCGLDHTILYMNPKARKIYPNIHAGGSILNCHPESVNQKIFRVTAWFTADSSHNRVHTFFNVEQNKDVYMIALRDDVGQLIGYYEKHEFRNRDLTPLYDCF